MVPPLLVIECGRGTMTMSFGYIYRFQKYIDEIPKSDEVIMKKHPTIREDKWPTPLCIQVNQILFSKLTFIVQRIDCSSVGKLARQILDQKGVERSQNHLASKEWLTITEPENPTYVVG